jgi:hypothetical protein
LKFLILKKKTSNNDNNTQDNSNNYQVSSIDGIQNTLRNKFNEICSNDSNKYNPDDITGEINISNFASGNNSNLYNNNTLGLNNSYQDGLNISYNFSNISQMNINININSSINELLNNSSYYVKLYFIYF